MQTPEEEFTERITSVIADYGVSEIARRLEIDPATVRLWRRGHRPYPQNIRSLCEKFHIDRQWLETGVESEERKTSESFPTLTLREEPRLAEFSTMSDDEIAQKLTAMIKNFSKVPVEFAASSLALVRAYAGEFITRAETRVQGAGVKYPVGKNHHSKRRQ